MELRMRLATVLLFGVMMTSSAFGASPAPSTPDSANTRAIEQLIARELVRPLIGEDGIGGVAVAVRVGSRTHFFNYGFADMQSRRPVTPDALFNIASLRKVFEATLLVDAAQRGELTLDDPVA
jgi:beta-lactamase class C